MSDEEKIEQMIQDKGLSEPRVTHKDLDDAMAQAKGIFYHRFPGTTMTVCCVVLANGFSLVGAAVGVNVGNFDEEVGREVAYKDAREQLWPLLGYKLKENMRDYAVSEPE